MKRTRFPRSQPTFMRIISYMTFPIWRLVERSEEKLCFVANFKLFIGFGSTEYIIWLQIEIRRFQQIQICRSMRNGKVKNKAQINLSINRNSSFRMAIFVNKQLSGTFELKSSVFVISSVMSFDSGFRNSPFYPARPQW